LRVSNTIYSLATSKKAKVAIGVDSKLESAEMVINSTLFAKREGYAEPVLISNEKISDNLSPEGIVGKEISLIIGKDVERTFVDLLKEGAVDAAVRGNLSSRTLVPLLRSEFKCKNLCRVTILDVGGRLVMLAPVGIEEGDSLEELITIAGYCKRLAIKLGIPYKIAVLSGGRMEDKGRSKKVDRMLSVSALLTNILQKKGMDAENFGIELERAVGGDATLLLAPDGIVGNIIFRSLVLVANVESFGAYAAALPRIYIDTSRAKASYLLPIIFASALSK
jgi:predicted methyltransferase MtxX (methanogen marker protein 4)